MRGFRECAIAFEEIPAVDFAYLALIAGLVLATVGFLWLCDRTGSRR